MPRDLWEKMDADAWLEKRQTFIKGNFGANTGNTRQGLREQERQRNGASEEGTKLARRE